MGAKAEYNPVPNGDGYRVITITQAPVGGKVEIDIQTDLYSDAKEDWLTGELLSKFTFPWTSIGGQDTGGGRKAGRLYFLRNDLGWRIRPYEADHELEFVGNLFPTDPDTGVYVPTSGGYTVFAPNTRSNLAEVVEVGTSGLTSEESTDLARIETVEKVLRNKTVTDPDSGVQIIYDDDSATPLFQADLYEDVSGEQPYRGQGAERRDRLA
jgi:hypothetical protein